MKRFLSFMCSCFAFSNGFAADLILDTAVPSEPIVVVNRTEPVAVSGWFGLLPTSTFEVDMSGMKVTTIDPMVGTGPRIQPHADVICQRLSWRGVSGWRLPSQLELNALVSLGLSTLPGFFPELPLWESRMTSSDYDAISTQGHHTVTQRCAELGHGDGSMACQMAHIRFQDTLDETFDSVSGRDIITGKWFAWASNSGQHNSVVCVRK